MKKLTKIKLVNWHLFSNQTIKIDKNTLVSGENGAGKSTLLDAMQYLLIGGKGGAKFNTAANNEAKRTLDGYVRGKIGAIDKQFLRDGDVISHIAMEFKNTENDELGIIGAILDYNKSGNNLKEQLYLIENVGIHDEMFVDENFPRNYKSMKEYLKIKGHELEVFDTQKSYRGAIARYFGIDALKYSKLLPKAMAFKPMDLNNFIFEFLLDDDPIDIKSLKINVEKLRQIETQIIKDKEKLTKLDVISNLGEEITDSKNQITINEIVNQLNWIEQREKFIKQNEKDLLLIEQKLETFRSQKVKIDLEIEENDAQILNLEKSRSSDGLERTINQYKETFRKKEIEYQNEKESLSRVKELLEEEAENIKNLASLIDSSSLKSFVGYYKANTNNLNPTTLSEQLSLIASEIKSYRQEYYNEKEKYILEKEKISNNIYHASHRLSQLKKNVKTYPENVQKLILRLNEGLSESFQKEIKVQPLAELIEVNDEKWRDALEGYLSAQKFNLIVEPEYFDLALDIYDKEKNELQIYGVGLVNTQKLGEYEYVDPKSLSSKIDTDYKHARYYVNMILNGVITVEKAEELKKYSRSITPTCMTYANYTARQLNPRSYKVPFIGSSATDIQSQIELDDLEMLEKEVEKYNELIRKQNSILRLLENSKAEQIIHQNQLGLITKINETRSEYTLLEEKINELSKAPSIAKLEIQLQNELNQKRILRVQSDEIVGNISNIRTERQRLLDNIEEIKEKIKEYSSNNDELSKKHPEKLISARDHFNRLKMRFNNSNSAIGEDLRKDSSSLNNQINKKEIELVNLMRMYTREYQFASAPNFESLNEFIKEGNIIRNNNLIKYEAEAIELRRSSEIGFKEEFINKLKASIETAQQQIDDLNVALSGKMFGGDSYKLIYNASEDRDYSVYYNMIMDSKTFNDNKLFTEGLNKKNEEILMELFEKITSPDPKYDQLALKFLDYRNYMSYDIEVTHKTGNVSLFSKVSREKSGGETQVPFYIVIAASFQQLLSRNKKISSGCIVLFDEAFNNMDESRIDAMMKFYTSLSIQLVIAVPPQRVVNIINYVNTSLVIVKENDYAVVAEFKDHRELDIN